jgi:hypothetical protein
MEPEIKISFAKLRPISMLHFETQVGSRFVVTRAGIQQSIVKFVRDWEQTISSATLSRLELEEIERLSSLA